MTVTAGTVRLALGALQGIDLGALEGAVSSRLSNLQDDAIVAEDVLGVLSIFFPQLSLMLALASLVIDLAARGVLTPGTSGEGQTTPPEHGYQGR